MPADATASIAAPLAAAFIIACLRLTPEADAPRPIILPIPTLNTFIGSETAAKTFTPTVSANSPTASSPSIPSYRLEPKRPAISSARLYTRNALARWSAN